MLITKKMFKQLSTEAKAKVAGIGVILFLNLLTKISLLFYLIALLVIAAYFFKRNKAISVLVIIGILTFPTYVYSFLALFLAIIVCLCWPIITSQTQKILTSLTKVRRAHVS